MLVSNSFLKASHCSLVTIWLSVSSRPTSLSRSEAAWMVCWPVACTYCCAQALARWSWLMTKLSISAPASIPLSSLSSLIMVSNTICPSTCCCKSADSVLFCWFFSNSCAKFMRCWNSWIPIEVLPTFATELSLNSESSLKRSPSTKAAKAPPTTTIRNTDLFLIFSNAAIIYNLLCLVGLYHAFNGFFANKHAKIVIFTKLYTILVLFFDLLKFKSSKKGCFLCVHYCSRLGMRRPSAMGL